MKSAILLILTFLCISAYAEFPDSRSRFGVEVQGFSNPYNFVQGGTIGVHAGRYFDDTNVHYGFSLLTGSRNGGSLATDNLTYGGFQLGYDRSLLDIFHLEADVLVGYGYGANQQGMTLQPTVGAGLIVINGWRAVFTIGYLYTPMVNVSGITFGVKLDRKTVGSAYGEDR